MGYYLPMNNPFEYLLEAKRIIEEEPELARAQLECLDLAVKLDHPELWEKLCQIRPEFRDQLPAPWRPSTASSAALLRLGNGV